MEIAITVDPLPSPLPSSQTPSSSKKKKGLGYTKLESYKRVEGAFSMLSDELLICIYDYLDISTMIVIPMICRRIRKVSSFSILQKLSLMILLKQ